MAYAVLYWIVFAACCTATIDCTVHRGLAQSCAAPHCVASLEFRQDISAQWWNRCCHLKRYHDRLFRNWHHLAPQLDIRFSHDQIELIESSLRLFVQPGVPLCLCHTVHTQTPRHTQTHRHTHRHTHTERRTERHTDTDCKQVVQAQTRTKNLPTNLQTDRARNMFLETTKLVFKIKCCAPMGARNFFSNKTKTQIWARLFQANNHFEKKTKLFFFKTKCCAPMGARNFVFKKTFCCARPTIPSIRLWPGHKLQTGTLRQNCLDNHGHTRRHAPACASPHDLQAAVTKLDIPKNSPRATPTAALCRHAYLRNSLLLNRCHAPKLTSKRMSHPTCGWQPPLPVLKLNSKFHTKPVNARWQLSEIRRGFRRPYDHVKSNWYQIGNPLLPQNLINNPTECHPDATPIVVLPPNAIARTASPINCWPWLGSLQPEWLQHETCHQ